MLEHPAGQSKRNCDGAAQSQVGFDRRSTCGGARVLVVEDDEVTGRVLVRLLSSAGYEATHVSDYRTALKTACEWLPDILICDIDLHAARDGCDVLKTMRQGYPGLRAISVSGHERLAAECSSRRAGFQSHLCKPFEFDQLLENIEAILHSRNRSTRRAPAVN